MVSVPTNTRLAPAGANRVLVERTRSAAPVGMRSRASGAECLDATFCVSANALFCAIGAQAFLYLHLHLLWTCCAGSRGSASLPSQGMCLRYPIYCQIRNQAG